MKQILRISYLSVSVLFIWYLALPSLQFPEPPQDAVRSLEPADSETDERRAYFTNYTREEINEHYQQQYKLRIMGHELSSYVLIYPPEDAYEIIRDQTRSTHLREIVYPFRESLYINEFVAKDAKDDIWYKGVHYDQKITVKIKQSSPNLRVTLGLGILIGVWLVVSEIGETTKYLFSVLKKLNWPFFWLK